MSDDKKYEISVQAFLNMERINEAGDLTYDEAKIVWQLLTRAEEECDYEVKHALNEHWRQWWPKRKADILSIKQKMFY